MADQNKSSAKFSFRYLSKKFNSIETKDTQEFFKKWSMKGRLFGQSYAFDQPFQSYQKEEFAKAFMSDSDVTQTLQVVSDSGKQVPLGMTSEEVTVEQIPCATLSMEFFDRLEKHGIVRENGRINKCFDEYYEDITIGDELRKVLLIEDSDNYDIFDDTEREEFLFLLFRHICLGGSLCQYEDEVKPYLDITKLIYKDLVSVQKDPGSGKIHITSTVLKVTAKKDGSLMYPSSDDHIQDFAYLIIDPLKRHVNVLYHRFGVSDME